MYKSINRYGLTVMLWVAVIASAGIGDIAGSWTFDGEGGLNDIGGSGNNAQIVGGATFSDDCVLGGKSVLLNGTDSYIKLSGGDDFKGDFSGGQASLSFWVKLNASSGLNAALASISEWASPSFYTASGTGVISLRLFLSDGAPAAVNFPQSYNIYKWNHIAVTVDAADIYAGYKVYLNGQLAGQYPMDGTHGNFLPPINPRLGITYDVSTNTAYYLNGLIDEAIICNHTLSASEIKTLATIGDIDGDGLAAMSDWIVIAKNWHKACGADWCGGSDFDRNGSVDFDDLVFFAAKWLD